MDGTKNDHLSSRPDAGNNLAPPRRELAQSCQAMRVQSGSDHRLNKRSMIKWRRSQNGSWQHFSNRSVGSPPHKGSSLWQHAVASAPLPSQDLPGCAQMDHKQDVSIGHLQRRKIEARVLIPFIEACRERFGEVRTRELVAATIRRLAADDGAKWAETYGRGFASLRRVAEDVWAGGGSLDIDVVGHTDDRLDFNVTRCRYAEFFKDLGLADIGHLVHCDRDHAMVAGFNPDIELLRTQTLMEGASHCDFRFRKKPANNTNTEHEP